MVIAIGQPIQCLLKKEAEDKHKRSIGVMSDDNKHKNAISINKL